MQRCTLVSTIAIGALLMTLRDSAAVDISVSGKKYRAHTFEGKLVLTDASGKPTALPGGAAEVTVAPGGKGVLVAAKGKGVRVHSFIRSKRSLRSRGGRMIVSAELAQGQSLAVDEGTRHVAFATSSDAVAGNVVWIPKGGKRAMRLGIRLNPETQLVIRMGSLIVSQSTGQTTVTTNGLKFVVEDSATLATVQPVAHRRASRRWVSIRPALSHWPTQPALAHAGRVAA